MVKSPLRHRRAMGQESEYGHVALLNGKHEANFVANRILVYRFGLPSVYLPNGGRVYLDLGNHVEYATPECDNPDEVAMHVEAGHRYVGHRADTFCKRFSSHDERWELAVYANNTCNFQDGPDKSTRLAAQDDTFGMHYNLQCVRGGQSLEDFMAPAIAYLATRHIIFGAGRLRFNADRQPFFELSQRAQYVSADFSSTTTMKRGLVNTRDEPHATSNYRRLHLIMGDNHIHARQCALGFGLMDILLTMLEEQCLEGVDLRDPAGSARRISLDPAARLELAKGCTTSAIEVQQLYHDQFRRFLRQNLDLFAKRRWVNENGRHLWRLTQSLNPLNHVGQLCWATKQAMLERFQKSNPDATPGKLRALELSMHQINGPNTLRQRLLNKYPQYSDEDIKRALTTAPATTRAHARGKMVELGARVDWTHIQLETLPASYAVLGDPLDPRPAALAAYL